MHLTFRLADILLLPYFLPNFSHLSPPSTDDAEGYAACGSLSCTSSKKGRLWPEFGVRTAAFFTKGRVRRCLRIILLTRVSSSASSGRSLKNFPTASFISASVCHPADSLRCAAEAVASAVKPSPRSRSNEGDTCGAAGFP